MHSSSAREKTLPVGLLGELRMIALVRGVKAARSSSGSKVQSGARKVDVPRGGAAKLRVGPVVFVEGFEKHHFVAGIEHRQQAGDHAFGRAAADRDLALGVELDSVSALVFGGDGIAERLGAPGDGVLIDIGVDGLGGSVLEDRGSGKVREALRQVDGPVMHGQAGHLANDGFGKSGDPLAAESGA